MSSPSATTSSRATVRTCSSSSARRSASRRLRRRALTPNSRAPAPTSTTRTTGKPPPSSLPLTVRALGGLGAVDAVHEVIEQGGRALAVLGLCGFDGKVARHALRQHSPAAAGDELAPEHPGVGAGLVDRAGDIKQRGARFAARLPGRAGLHHGEVDRAGVRLGDLVAQLLRLVVAQRPFRVRVHVDRVQGERVGGPVELILGLRAPTQYEHEEEREQ